MEKIREDFDYIKQALDDMLYYNPEELERQADEYEREMARKEGREEGREVGREETMKDIVLNMYKNSFSIEDIIKCTKLTKNQIEQVISKKI